MSVKHLSVSKARASLPKLIESIERTVITRNGEPAAVLLHIDDYRALRAFRSMAAHPNRLAVALHAHKRVQSGDVGGLVDLTDALERERGTLLDAVTYEAPRTPEERVLAGVWEEILGVEHVGVRDDFFELGGHSLLATRVVARVSSQLGVDLPLRSLFRNPTVVGLATEIADRMRATVSTEESSVRERSSERANEVAEPAARED